ncbi:exocyst complex component Sec6-domain-containing protein [Lipomyces oligophaga]|uniref:exocyst complex component Sec6-domain-containing protein n=1 Tax=Lipomyces oligophaga TaxID=45792 RepID=UPI0034CF020C
MGDQSGSAISSLAELLRYPDDLPKIPSLKERLQRDKAAIDLQIKSGVQTQLNLTLSGVKNLLDARTAVSSLGDQLGDLNALFGKASSVVPDFEQISRVTRVRHNFLAVEDVIRNLEQLPAQVEEIESMITADGKDIFGPMTNFLSIHHRLSRLRDFRDQTIAQATKTGADLGATLTTHFSLLDDLVKEFDNILFDVAQNLLEVLREGNASLIVRWAKVIEVDECLDAKAKSPTSARSRTDSVIRINIQGAGAYRTPRNYVDKLTGCIRLGAQDVFRNCVESFPDDPGALLDNLYWVTRDILFAKTDLTKCVPERWQIAERFIAAYHQEMYLLMKSLVTKDTEAGVLLKVVRWAQKYNDTMTNELKIARKQLVPPLLDGQEDQILGDYMRLICLKIDEWTQSLMRSEFKEFVERKSPPELDPESKYGCANTPIAFQMLNQQISVSLESDEIRVVDGVVTEIKRQLLVRQKKWVAAIHTEIDKSNTSPDDVPGGLLEYCIAVANDQVRGADYTESIISRQIETNVDVLVHSDEDRVKQSHMIQELEDAMDGFISTAKSCIGEIINGMVIYDIQPSLVNLFGPSWHNPSPVSSDTSSVPPQGGSVYIQECIRTFEDYNVDLMEHLNPDLFSIYIDDLLDATLIGYLGAVSRNKNASLSARSIDQIKGDVSLLYPFFSRFTDKEHIEAEFVGIEVLMGLISGDKYAVVEEFRNLKESFPDAPLQFVIDVLKAREDLESKAVKEYVEAIRHECSSLLAATSEENNTFMSRLYLT